MKKRYRRTFTSQYLYLALFLIFLAGLGYLSFIILQSISVEDHFVLPWAAGRLWLLEGVSPYDDIVTAFAIETLDQSSFLGSLPTPNKLIDPVINLVIYLPFSLIPYEISRVIWTTLSIIIVGLIGYFSIKLSGWQNSLLENIGVIFIFLLWLPGINVVLKGQISSFIIFSILISIYWVLSGKDTQAGFLLALTFGSLLMSGLITLLLIVWCISRRRWKILTAYFTGVAFLFAVTLLLLPSWHINWLQIILEFYGNWDWIRTPLMNLASILPGVANYLSIFFHVILGIYMLINWFNLLGKTGRVFTWKVLVMLVMAYLFHVKPSISHLFLVIPALFMVFRFWTERWRLFGRISSWIFLILIGSGSWLLAGHDISFNSDFSLPWLSVGLPVLVFIGMNWIRWWALKLPHLSFESR